MKTVSVGEAYAESGASPPALEAPARSTPLEDCPDLLADLARAQAIALATLATPVNADKNPLPVPDAWSWLALAATVRERRAS